MTGGRYEEHSYHTVGSGSVFAKGSLKKRWSPRLSAEDAVRVVVEALHDAADDDSATGGPDTARAIYPVVATVSADGYQRISDDVLARRADRATPTRHSPRPKEANGDDHALLRLARAADEGPGGLCAQGHRARSLGHRPRLRRRHRVRHGEPVPGAAQDQRDLRPDRLRRGRQVQRVREPARRRGALRRPAWLRLRPRGRHRPGAGQRLRPDARHVVHDGVQAAARSNWSSPRWVRGRGGPDLPPHL